MRGTYGHKVNRASVTFNSKEIRFPRSTSSYQVIATAHHAGGVSQGHWKSKLKIKNDWIYMDSAITSTSPPGDRRDDGSLSLLVLKRN